MRRSWTLPRGLTALAAGLVVVLGGAVAAETKVELKGVHLCCGACVKGVATALKGVEGVTAKCDRPKSTVSLTATDEAAARKALDALGAAGYFGESSDKALTIKPGAASAGKVKTVTLAGVHNCCGRCNSAIKAAVKKAAGVTGETVKVNAETFTVTGDFSPEDVVKSLNAAGFNATVKD